jgi:flavodoxin
MAIGIIFHSFTGITRAVAEQVHTACGGEMIEVKPREPYCKLTAYTLGGYRAVKEACDPIEPGIIDVTPYDLIVIGTPVWAFKATPAVNGAIAALQGCEGKQAVIFATCGGAAKNTLPILRKKLEGKGMAVRAEMVFTSKDIDTGDRINDLIKAVRATDPSANQSA